MFIKSFSYIVDLCFTDTKVLSEMLDKRLSLINAYEISDDVS